MSIRIPVALIACAALVAGCGSSSSSSKSTSSGSSKPAAASSSSSSGSGTVTIKMQNIAFAPTSVTVKKGQTVKWVNEDTVAHNVTAKKGATFKSSTFPKGGTFTWKANTTGTIDYVCTIHPNMTATLTVQ
jgi:plastocyanin